MRLTPLCFDSFDSFTEWLEHSASTKHDEWNYCNDCLPEYKQKMVEQNRCYHPETYFMAKLTSDKYGRGGELVGVACHDGDYTEHLEKRYRRIIRGRTFDKTEDGERILKNWCEE